MKAKLFALLGLIIASTGLALIVGSTPANAAGEKYRWINPTTIEASGGLYNNVTAANNGVLNFPRNGNTFIVFSDGDCDITLTIAPSPDNKTGKLTTQGCDEPAAGFDRDITITSPENGPPVGTFPAPTETGDEGEDAEDKTSCAVDGIGWIICPVVTFLSTIVDAAYSVVASLLAVQPLMTTGETKTIYDAWSTMRNIANVAFVIAFLLIIFSQISSIGITNYGIKKMLPRLIISAVLVNISYWVCAAAIDLSNITGASIKDLFEGIGATFGIPSSDTTALKSGGGLAGFAGGLLAGGAAIGVALYVGLSAFLPMIIAALFAVLMVFILLALRQALIILLVVIAPLAFVAYLLPNTESLFNKWRNLLQVLLLMYPMISAIFGGAALASTLVMASAESIQDPTQKLVVQIMGAGIAVVPLGATVATLKASSALSKFGGRFINDPNKGPFDRMKRGAEGYRKNRQTLRQNRALNGGRRLPFYAGGVKRRARRNAVNASREAGLRDAQTRYVSEQARANGGDNAFAAQMAGGSRVTAANERAQTAVIASALSQEKKNFQEDVSNMEALIKVRFDDPGEALKEAIANGDRTSAVAAQNILFKSGGSGVSKFREIVEQSEANPATQAGLSQVSDDLRSNVKDNHGQYAKQKGADIVKWANDKSTSLTDASAGRLSDNDLAGQHADGIEKMVRQGLVDSTQARRMLSDPRVSANLDDKQKAHLTAAAGGDLRATPSRDEIDIAHEEALVQNALHGMNNNNPPNPPNP